MQRTPERLPPAPAFFYLFCFDRPSRDGRIRYFSVVLTVAALQFRLRFILLRFKPGQQLCDDDADRAAKQGQQHFCRICILHGNDDQR